MTSTLFRETLRSIRKTKARFISIIAIVALGISFFAGIKAAHPDMHETAVRYYEKNNLMDIWMVSTIGFSDEDINKIRNVEGVENAMGSKFVDGAVEVNGEPVSDMGGSQTICRVYGLDINKAINFENGENDPTYINRVTLLDGRYPQNPGECLVDQNGVATPKEFVVGNKITVVGVEENLDKQLRKTEFTIVGIIRTPRYVSIERGQTTVGSGSLGCFIYVPEDAFEIPFYSEICVKAEVDKSSSPYSDLYFKKVQSIIENINKISSSCLDYTSGQVKEYFSIELEEAKLEYAAAEADAKAQIDNATEELKKNEDKINNSQAQLQAAKEQAEREFQQKYQQLISGQSQYAQGLEEYNTKYNQYLSYKSRLDSAKKSFSRYENQLPSLKETYNYSVKVKKEISELQQTRNNILNQIKENETKISFLNQQISDLENATTSSEDETLPDYSYKIESLRSQVNDLKAENEQLTIRSNEISNQISQKQSDSKYDKNTSSLSLRISFIENLADEVKNYEKQLQSAKVELDKAKKQLEDAGLKIDDGWEQYNAALEKANNELQTNSEALSDAKEQYNNATVEYSKGKEEAMAKLDEARYAIEQSEEKINASLNNKQWYLNDRNALPGYEGYGQTAENMKAFSTVFPLFFFLVAALVCLTTMTRMIDEERTQLGTLKALGYSSSSIRAKYLFYSFLASIIGCILGLSFGLVVYPKAIFSAYSLMYCMPDLVILYPVKYMLSGTVFATATTMLATYFACRREMKSCPSQLMRPKAPKAGKRIFLEKIPFIWKRMNFTSKVTARNIFRNKKRFIMTLIGIAGCSALLLTGFGLSDSIDAIITTQYGKEGIIHADCQIAFKNSQPADKQSEIYNSLVNNKNISEVMMFYSKSTTAFCEENSEEFTVNFVVPQHKEMLPDFVKLQDRKTKEKHLLTDAGRSDDFGVLISEKIAKELNVRVGEAIKLKYNDDVLELPVSAIIENYTYHYVYMSPERYMDVFKEAPSFNYAYIRYSDAIRNIENDAERNRVRTENAEFMMKFNDINAVIDIVNSSESFSTMFESLDSVIMLFIVSAAALAFVVLYNLTNININERKREIATLKVLGFHNYQSTSYIGRENFIITILGTIIGVFAGIFLHKFVVEVAEVNVVMFGRTINYMSYIWSVVLTFVFSILVSIFMSFNIKRIHMVESLKSIE